MPFYTYRIKKPFDQQLGVDFLTDNPFIRFHAFFQSPSVFRKELWSLLQNKVTKKYNKTLELNIKEYLNNIYNYNKEENDVYLLAPEQMLDNVEIICNYMNYLVKLEKDSPEEFEKLTQTRIKPKKIKKLKNL